MLLIAHIDSFPDRTNGATSGSKKVYSLGSLGSSGDVEVTDLIFVSVNRLIHKEEDTEDIYCDQVIDGDRVYAEIQIKTYDGGGNLTVLRPHRYVRLQESWLLPRGSKVFEIDLPIIKKLNAMEPAV